MDSPCFLETVDLLRRVARSHEVALAGLLEEACAVESREDEPESLVALGVDEAVRALEDIAIDALARLARAESCEKALGAIEQSGTAGWLWGAILNRALGTAALPKAAFVAARMAPPESRPTQASYGGARPNIRT